MIRGTIESFCPALITRQQEIIHIEEPNCVGNILFGDDGRIRQCLVNLLSNAMKFSSDMITVGTNIVENEKEGSAMLYLSVIDR